MEIDGFNPTFITSSNDSTADTEEIGEYILGFVYNPIPLNLTLCLAASGLCFLYLQGLKMTRWDL